MHSTVGTVPSPSCYCLFNELVLHRRNLTIQSFNNQIHIIGSLPRLRIFRKNNNCSRGHYEKHNLTFDSSSNQWHNHSLILQFYATKSNNSDDRDPGCNNQEQGKIYEIGGLKVKEKKLIFTNIWWVDMKAGLGQIFNFGGIISSAVVVLKDPKLGLPPLAVPDIRYIDWAELRRWGFKGVVFDKDNTLTAPYSLTLWGPLKSSVERCRSVFGSDMAVFSNSAGLVEFDIDGSKARALEGAIGIKVIRHRKKKPAATVEEIEEHFGCESSKLIMVGDRLFTDIVYGNRHGFLTILTEPLSLAEEPFVVRQVRKVENALLYYWRRRGLKPATNKLLQNPTLCVKNPHEETVE